MKTRGRDGAKRRLAAILAADVVGYSRLMGQDEFQLNFEPLGAHRPVSRAMRSHTRRRGSLLFTNDEMRSRVWLLRGRMANRCRDARSPREHVVALIIAARGLGQ